VLDSFIERGQIDLGCVLVIFGPPRGHIATGGSERAQQDVSEQQQRNGGGW